MSQRCSLRLCAEEGVFQTLLASGVSFCPFLFPSLLMHSVDPTSLSAFWRAGSWGLPREVRSEVGLSGQIILQEKAGTCGMGREQDAICLTCHFARRQPVRPPKASPVGQPAPPPTRPGPTQGPPRLRPPPRPFRGIPTSGSDGPRH